MFEPLPDDIADALAQSAHPTDLRSVAEAGSTNDIAMALAQAGAPDGTAVLADAQTAGRGRRGRSWFSPPGSGIYLSAIVRFGAPVTLSLVTLAAGVAAAEAVTATSGLPLELKWPNDLVVGASWRKLGGVLCESVPGPRVDAVIVGIGINRAAGAFPLELADRATAIEIELGRPVDRAPLVVACLVRLAQQIARLRVGGDAEVVRAWRELGRGGFGLLVRWQDQGQDRTGVARDIDPTGALVVESRTSAGSVDAGGRVERLIAGEVIWDRRTHG
jgi:BirA family biotin operon repressor/biotin-[acetyl-CoA-carboxylase] ligase